MNLMLKPSQLRINMLPPTGMSDPKAVDSKGWGARDLAIRRPENKRTPAKFAHKKTRSTRSTTSNNCPNPIQTA